MLVRFPGIIRMIWERWPRVKILVRGDSGFAIIISVENLMRWCENNRVDYVFGLARNSNLLQKAQKIRSKAARDMLRSHKTARAYGDFHHMTKSKIWAWPPIKTFFWGG